jgi:DNA-binding beta-propeller fold protein YncE
MSPRLRLPATLLLALLGLVPLHAAKLVLVAGGPEARTGIPATRARLVEPYGVDFDAQGNMFIVEMDTSNRLLKVDARGLLSHVAGGLPPGDSDDGGPAPLARFNGPHNLAVLPDGDVLIADTWNGRVRHVRMSSGTVTGVPGFAVPPERARREGPYCIALDPAGGTLYLADLTRVQALDLKTGQSRIVAGNGQKGIPADGSVATLSPLSDPRAVAVDRRGNLYIL